MEAGVAQMRDPECLTRGSNWRHVEHWVQQIFRRFVEGTGGVEGQGGLEDDSQVSCFSSCLSSSSL